jgi:RHS repeat-associated protein
VTRRYFDPYGNPIGAAPASWPGNKGYVGGTADPMTGLTNLGAREYDPASASFLSPDPLLKPYDPQNLDPYAYAEGNPSTYADPSGQRINAPSGACQNGDCTGEPDRIFCCC